MTASTSVHAASVDDIDEERRLTALAATELPRVRAVANSWRTGASISSSVVTAAGLVSAPEPLAAASAGVVTWVGFLLLGAALTTLLSLGASLRASFGWPRTLQLRQMNALREWEQRELARIVTWLGVSMVSAFAAALLAAAAFGALYFGPRADAEPPEPASLPAATAVPDGTPAPAPPGTEAATA